MNGIYEPKTLLAAIELILSAGNFLTKTFFSKEETYNTRMIEVDLVKGRRPLAPYVSPVREGVVMKKQGKKTAQIKLPYLKPKYDISAVEAALRQQGENPYSARTPYQRAEEILGKRLMEGKNAINRNIEVQAAQALILGKVIASGKSDNDQDWSIEVDWERDPGNTITKAPAGYWTLADVDPIADLRAWRQSLFRTGSRYADVAIMGWDVLSAFLGNPNVQKLLDNRNDVSRGQINNVDKGRV